MKIIYTIILIIFVTAGSFAQPKNNFDQSSGSVIPTIISDNQSFVISKIYPNPVKEFVSIEIQSLQTGLLQVKLYNILGTELKNWEPFYLSLGDQKLKLDLSFLKTGVYILKFSKSDLIISQVIRKN